MGNVSSHAGPWREAKGFNVRDAAELAHSYRQVLLRRRAVSFSNVSHLLADHGARGLQ